MREIRFVNTLSATAVTFEKQSFLKRLFGCWHGRLSRPVTINGVTFCYCKDCGLRRRYDIESGRHHGSFYAERPLNAPEAI
jgi:hypothetical protein